MTLSQLLHKTYDVIEHFMKDAGWQYCMDPLYNCLKYPNLKDSVKTYNASMKNNMKLVGILNQTQCHYISKTNQNC